ncbi:MAG: GTP-binding protein [Pseudomonas sp.]|uniref:YdcH family protein n=1 Tax=Pseudomonas sp. TaxID=306 RepID=UPI003D0A4EB1
MHIDYSAQSEPDFQRLRRNPAYAALAEQYEDVIRRIARIEDGIERPDGVPLSALKLRRSGLREDLVRLQRKTEEGCCNCGRNCSG